MHEAIGADAQVFAVTAVGDESKGERLAVLHTLDEGRVAEALRKVSAAGLPNLFIPRRDHFLKVDAIPILGTGKLDLRAIRRIAEETLGDRGACGVVISPGRNDRFSWISPFSAWRRIPFLRPSRAGRKSPPPRKINVDVFLYARFKFSNIY